MTAVEFLIDKFKIYLPSIHQKGLQDTFEQALQLEKEQHELTWEKSGNGSYQNINFEKYYSETYKKDKK